MTLAGTCQVCNNLSHTLMICMSCGAKVCVNCIDPRTGVCLKCKGEITRK